MSGLPERLWIPCQGRQRTQLPMPNASICQRDQAPTGCLNWTSNRVAGGGQGELRASVRRWPLRSPGHERNRQPLGPRVEGCDGHRWPILWPPKGVSPSSQDVEGLFGSKLGPQLSYGERGRPKAEGEKKG